jgi:hypothetical protein
MIERVLFQTRFGETLLLLLEKLTGLSIVRADWLAAQQAAYPQAVDGH